MDTPPAGFSVAGVGDVNGDGLADVAVSAPFASNNGRSGSVYVVFGRRDSATVDLRNLGSAGYRVDGPGRASTLGYRIAAVGDVNGDGIPDLLATGAYYSAYLGGRTRSWVVYGQRTPGVVDLAQPGHGYEISLPGYHFLTAAGIGDVNGDGIPDLAIGDPMAEPMTVRRTFRIGKRRFVRKETVYNGRVFVVYGQRNAAPVDLAHLGRGGYVIDGPRGGQLSSTLAGDLNGDGRPDLLVGAPGAGDPAGPASSPPYAPTVYGIFGSPPGSRVNLADPRTPALRLIGDAGDGTGPAVGLGALPATAGRTVAVGSPYASAPCRQGYAFRGSERVSRVLVVCRETCVRGGCKSGCRAAELCGA